MRGRGGRDEELALRLAARQRAAPPSFPAARFQLKKGAEPRRRVLAGLELSPDKPATLAQALLLAPGLLQRQAGDRAAQIALGVLAGLEEGSGRPVAQPDSEGGGLGAGQPHGAALQALEGAEAAGLDVGHGEVS